MLCFHCRGMQCPRTRRENYTPQHSHTPSQFLNLAAWRCIYCRNWKSFATKPDAHYVRCRRPTMSTTRSKIIAFRAPRQRDPVASLTDVRLSSFVGRRPSQEDWMLTSVVMGHEIFALAAPNSF